MSENNEPIFSVLTGKEECCVWVSFNIHPDSIEYFQEVDGGVFTNSGWEFCVDGNGNGTAIKIRDCSDSTDPGEPFQNQGLQGIPVSPTGPHRPCLLPCTG